VKVSFLTRIIAIDTPFSAKLIDGVIHHEGLNADRPPCIEDCEMEMGGTITQLILRLK
jgi:hypothetical protein